MKPAIQRAALACAAALLASALSTGAAAAPVIEGMSQEKGHALLATFSEKIVQFAPGKIAVEEIDYISPAPLGAGFYLVSARHGRFVAVVDEQVTSVLLLAGYANLANGRRQDLVTQLRQRFGAATVQAAPVRAIEGAIIYGNGPRVVRVVTDPNCAACIRFHNDVLKRSAGVTAHIFPVSVNAPGNWKETALRELLCWPKELQPAQWDEILNGSAAAAKFGVLTCSREHRLDENTAALRANYSAQKLPLLVLPNGQSAAGEGMSLAEFERFISK